jgi:hypothetical protein
MNLTAEYQITLEEFTEAMRHLQKDAQKQLFSRGSKRSIFGWVLFIGLAIVFFILLKRRNASSAPPPPSTPSEDNPVLKMLLPALPWLLIFGFIWFFVYRQVRGGYKRLFDSTPALHRVRKLQVREDGLSMIEATAESRVTWDHYLQFTETPNLFLLYVATNAAEFIPKRVFPTEMAMNGFRTLLERNISPPAGAFPVVPVNPTEPSARASVPESES